MSGTDPAPSGQPAPQAKRNAVKPFIHGTLAGVAYACALVTAGGLADMNVLQPVMGVAFLVLFFGLPVALIACVLLRSRPGWKPFMLGVLFSIVLSPLWLIGLCAVGVIRAPVH